MGLSRMISEASDPAVLFDLDGTLVDTAYRHVTSWASALRDAGISFLNGRFIDASG
jgi:beta-phosphoglucomutase-like phosphatase (HAD superfamily)